MHMDATSHLSSGSAVLYAAALVPEGAELRFQVSSIIREGKRQRFCQQCGRFHELTSFDGDKRSCRARLQRHNARRRKKTADVDAPSASKTATVKRQSSIGRGSRTDSSKKQQTSDSASVSPCPLPCPIVLRSPSLVRPGTVQV